MEMIPHLVIYYENIKLFLMTKQIFFSAFFHGRNHYTLPFKNQMDSFIKTKKFKLLN